MGRRSGFFAALARASREAERAERRRMRAAVQEMRASHRLEAAQRKAQELYLAQLEVEEFESTIAALTSVHRECSVGINWHALTAHQPAVDRSESQRLQAQIASYQPTLWERLWKTTRRRDQLIADLQAAEANERAAWERAVIESNEIRQTATAVLSGNTDLYNRVIADTECLAELEEFGCLHRGGWVDPQTAWTSLRVGGPEIVPGVSKSLTKSGKLSTKKLPANQQMEHYQDFVCGVALRVARELCAMLPIQNVYCDVRAPVFDARTGLTPDELVLSVLCPAEVLNGARINFARVDASELVSSLRHEMKLTRGKGFLPVQSIMPVKALTSHQG